MIDVSNLSDSNTTNDMLDVSDVSDDDTINDVVNVSDVSDDDTINDVVNVSDASDDNTITGAKITAEQNTPQNEDEEHPKSIEELTQTINALKTELEAYKSNVAKQEAIAKQLNDFYDLFPDIPLKSIPDNVWEDVKNGNSLAAAYSIYEKRVTEAARRIQLINAKNAEKSAGVAGKNLTPEFFSADDVRKMSPSEVRANYAKIRRSMEKWN